jgi:hypothetical protein
MNTVTVTKLEWLKDENGNFIYDQNAIEKFYIKAVKSMEKQNAKIQANPMKFRGFSVCDPHAFAMLQVETFKHHFKMYNEVVLN